MSEESVKETAKKAVQRMGGFRYNIHRKDNEIGIQWEWLEKYIGRTYEVTAIKFVQTLFIVLLGGFATVIYLLLNPFRGFYVGLGVVLLWATFIAYSLMGMLHDTSSGSLLSTAQSMVRFKKRQKYIRQGKEAPMIDTGDGVVDEEGFVWRKNGNVARLLLIDGYTAPTSFPEDIKAQVAVATDYQLARLRNVAEVKMSTVQPQTAREQIREAKRRGRMSDRKAVKDITGQQSTLLEKNVEGRTLTTVQYILVVARDKQDLDRYLEIMEGKVRNGLYYSMVKQSKAQTEAKLTEIRQLL